MRLINKDNKIYLYDELKDKYKLIEPEDLEHILDENNNLYPDETIRIYFKFKEGKYKTNKKGYTSKKANIKQEYKSIADSTQKNYLVNKFLNDVSGLKDIDRLAFIKNPSVTTIKRFSVDEETKKKLINKFNEISKTYITIKEKGDDLDDMFDYFIANKINVSFPKAVKESFKSLIDKYLKGEKTKDEVKDYLIMNKDKFIDPRRPNNYDNFIKFMDDFIFKLSEDDIKNKTKTDEATQQLNDKLDEVIPEEISTLVFTNDDFEKTEAMEYAKKLNENNKFIPSEIFKDSHISNYKDSYFGNNSKAYRVLSYLSTNPDLKIESVENKDDEDFYISIIKTDVGNITIPLNKNQYLYDRLKTVVDNAARSKKIIISNDIFEGINTLKQLIESSKSKDKRAIKKEDLSSERIFNFDLDDENVKQILKTVGDDITKNEFVDFIDTYYNYYPKDKENYIIPKIELKGKEPYDNYYTDPLFNEESKSYSMPKIDKYYDRLFSVIPKSQLPEGFNQKIMKEKVKEYIELQKEFDEINKDLDKLNEKYEDKTKQLEKLNKYKNECKNKFEKLRNKYKKDKGITIKTLNEEQKKDFEATYEKELKPLRKDYDTEIKALEKDIGKLETNIGKLEEDKKDKQNEMENHVFISEKEAETYGLDEKTTNNLNEKIFEYINEYVINNLYYMNPPSAIVKPDNKIISRYNAQDELYDYAKLKKYYKQKLNELTNPFESMGGSWSYNVLNKIEELNDILKMSSGSWSYNVLNKIEELNDILK